MLIDCCDLNAWCFAIPRMAQNINTDNTQTTESVHKGSMMCLHKVVYYIREQNL